MHKHLKSDKTTSFFRQLDLYGFTRIKDDKGQLQFIHPIFTKGNEDKYITIKRKRQYQLEPKEMVKYEKMRQIVETLEKEKNNPGKNQCEAIRYSCLFKHLLTFQKYFGKNTEIYIRKFIIKTRLYFPELHSMRKREFHCLFIKLGKEEFMENTVEELGINLESVDRTNKKELFVSLINHLTTDYHHKCIKNHINSQETVSESKESFVSVITTNRQQKK